MVKWEDRLSATQLEGKTASLILSISFCSRGQSRSKQVLLLPTQVYPLIFASLSISQGAKAMGRSSERTTLLPSEPGYAAMVCQA